MKRYIRIVLFLALAATAGSLGVAWSNHAFQQGSNIPLTSSQILAQGQAALAVPIITSTPNEAGTAPQVQSAPVEQSQNTAQVSVNEQPTTAPANEPVAVNSLPPATTTPNVSNESPAAPLAVSEASAMPTTNNVVKSKAYDQISLGAGTLMNNVWGAAEGEQYFSAIYQSSDKTFGWSWTRTSAQPKSGQSSVTPIYPSIRVGGNMLERTKTQYFPVKLGDVQSLIFNMAYDYPAAPNGTYDLAYDLFLSDPSQPDTKPKIAAEVMIWVNYTAGQPAKNYKGDFSDGKNTFSLYSWTMSDGRLYYSFLLKSQTGTKGQYQIDAKKLMSQINLDSNWLIHGVEFGTEVYSGSSQIHVSQFDINLNGKNILTQ